METRRIRIGDEFYYIDTPEDFLVLVDRLLGWDAHDCLEEMLYAVPDGCTGECDHTYKIEEHYTHIMEDVLDELSGAIGKTETADKKIRHAKQMLRAGL